MNGNFIIHFFDQHDRKRSKILWRMTAVVLFVFMVSSALSLLFYFQATTNFAQSSKEKVITNSQEDMSSGFQYITNVVGQEMFEKYEEQRVDTAAFVTSLINKEPTPVQSEVNGVLEELVSKDFIGAEMLAAVLDAIPPTIPDANIIFSDDEEQMFKTVPASVQEIVDSGRSYGLIEEGIPELGLEDEQLVVIGSVDKELSMGTPVYTIGFRSMHGEIAAINNYYDKEKSKVNLLMLIIGGASLFGVGLVTFAVLKYTVKSQITEPIEELSVAAEKVMEGDLDIEVNVKEGEEFENLKTAFNEMIKSIRGVITRSAGEEYNF